MHTKIFFIIVLAFIYAACGNNQQSSSHDHEHEEEISHEGHSHATGEVHQHESESVDDHNQNHDHDHADEAAEAVHEHESAEEQAHEEESAHNHTTEEDAHDHGEAKIQLIEYTENFELFAEADPFVAGEESNILAHFTLLPGFEPLNDGTITARLIADESESAQTLEHPTRNGIYSFTIEPEKAGPAELIFEINRGDTTDEIHIHNLKVYADEHDAAHPAEEMESASLNTVVFTKEQSWKIDFATEPVRTEPFGEVIKTSALVQSAPGDEIQISAKTNGIVQFTGNELVEGQRVTNGRSLFTISGSGLAEDNLEVRFTEARNNFEQAKADYERAQELAEDKIVSQKALLEAKNQYENARAVYENLRDNFNNTGQTVTSPMTGFIKHLSVQNGEYVVAGQPLVTVSQNENLMLNAEVQQKYLPVLGAVHSANIRNMHSNETYTLDELNGKIVSWGRTANQNNYMLPINLQIDNKGSFVPGGFVELYLQTVTNAQAVTVPNSALLEEQGNFFVMVQLNPELFEKREVKTGTSDGLRTEITSGLQGNERVVTKGTVLVKLAQSTGTLDAHSGHVH